MHIYENIEPQLQSIALISLVYITIANVTNVSVVSKFRIATSEDSTLFASGSSDGTVKLWEAKRMEGRTTMLKATVTYAFQGTCLYESY